MWCKNYNLSAYTRIRVVRRLEAATDPAGHALDVE
jgi:hypothetical protein